MTLVRQHMVPSEGIADRILDLPPWENLLHARCLGRPKDAHVAILLLAEYPPSAVLCLLLALEGILGASLLVNCFEMAA
jgi:hypothetical protein